jgi:NADPH-dependent 2,4-dienoyl-CoA reductase/sulfur reductase-like enzyme/rhodanese-related sulfurtransferase
MSFNVVVIGGVAAGPKAAARIKRVIQNANVTVIEKGEFLSYAGCGLPYYISEVVEEQKELMSTPVGVVRDVGFFKKVKDITVLNHTEALKIDRKNKTVLVKNLKNNKEDTLPYDKLVIATGATPVVPPLPGLNSKGIFRLQSIEHAESIKAMINQNNAKDVAIIGGGLIGVEMAESLVQKGCNVTQVEMLPQLLNMLDWEMAHHVACHMKSKGVKVLTKTQVTEFVSENGVLKGLKFADGSTLNVDMAVLSIGVRPNTYLAQDCGLDIGETRAIKVNETMQTSDPDIYAAGDCCETTHLITGKPAFVPLGSTANKQGRVAANNISGHKDSFKGILGSTVCKVFDFTVGVTGLTEKAAKEAGFESLGILCPSPDKPHFMPEAKPLFLKLVVDKNTRKLLGLQAVGMGDGDKRIDIAAMALHSGMTVDDISNMDLCYAPPFSPAMDNIITAANIARNALDGLIDVISPEQVKSKLNNNEDFQFLDIRSPMEYEQMRIPGAKLFPLGMLRSKLDELDKNKPVVAFCKISLRGYEASRILKQHGFSNVKVMLGGVLMWPYEKEM